MTSKPPTSLNSLLVERPGYRKGRACLRGTGITVHQIAAAHNMGFSADELAGQNPDLDKALFYAALAYYFANKDQIDFEIEQDRQRGVELAKQYPEGITTASFTIR
jgi:uncharacterized protein (DUF433 family)